MNNLNNKTKESNKNMNEVNSNFDDELNDINYDDIDYDLNEGNSQNKNNNKITPKISKLKKVTTPYERLELLDQLEMENQKETEELLEKMKNQNISQNSEDV